MKFYSENQVKVLLEALRPPCYCKQIPKFVSSKCEFCQALEAFAKIEPVSVPEFDEKVAKKAHYVDHRTNKDPLDYTLGAEWENERIRKLMEDK